jgi:serine beta-lactamase-like protein LACTB
MFNLCSISLAFLLMINVFPQNINRKLDQYLTEYYINKDVPSISAGLMMDGKVIWLGTKGYTDIENKVPATEESVYRIASISKAITAVAIMQLVEQGKIHLDDDARKYIPYFPAKKWKFTIRQLLNHTAGIRNYKSTGEFESKDFFQSTREAINYLAKDSLSYQPGMKYSYTTLGYNLLAAIIENVAGISFSEYLKKNIFEPSDMQSTFPDFQRNIIPNRAKGYQRNNFREIQNSALADLSIKIPGGGLVSTAEDLLKFSDCLLTEKLIKKTTLESMIEPTKLINGKIINYGLGFSFGIDESGRRFFSHAGTGTGFTSLLIIYPEEKIAAVHLLNIRDRNLGSPADDIISIFFGKTFEKPKRSLANKLLFITLHAGIDSALTAYGAYKPDTSNYNITTEKLKLFGYDLINTNRYVDAIKFFKMLTIEYSDYADAFIGLGDAYYKDGNKGLSLKNFRLALRLDPVNGYAAEMLKKLGGI